MRADEFVTILRAQAPGHEELRQHELSDTEIEQILRAFHAKRRVDAPPAPGSESEIEKLLRLYDCSTLEIGLVHFNSQVESHPAGKAVARWEADPIVVLPSGEVVAFDHADPAHRTGEISSDAGRLLAALAALAGIIRRKDDWRGRAADAAAQCASQAGGDRYQPFFQAMCAFFE